MRLHPPPLAREFIASYGEMSRRSGDLSAVARSAEVEAAEEDNQTRSGSRTSWKTSTVVGEDVHAGHVEVARSLQHVAVVRIDLFKAMFLGASQV